MKRSNLTPGLYIPLGQLPPEVEADLAALAELRREWEQYLYSVFGIPAELRRDESGSRSELVVTSVVTPTGSEASEG